jgi:hypothetical protein
LPWRQQIALRQKLHSADQRLWYAAEAIEKRWFKNIVAHHVAGRLHERSGKTLSNFAVTLPLLELLLSSSARAFVVIELKSTAFEPGYLGQLGMCMAAVMTCASMLTLSRPSTLCCAAPRTTVTSSFREQPFSLPGNRPFRATPTTRSHP